MTAKKLIPTFMMAAMMLCTSAMAQPASELLEKAIFAEETVGNLDEAIEIYKQILDDAEANRALAARAQLRLAQCYMKKGLDTEATEAFEKLIENYPDQEELVARARQEMPGRMVIGPVPWEDGEVMRMIMTLPTGMEIGTFVWTADRVTTDAGVEAWRVQTRRYIALNGTQGISGVVAEAETFRPISSWFEHSMIGDVRAVYTPTEVKMTGEGRRKGHYLEVGLDDAVYDNEQAMHLVRRLPLAVGYKTKLPVFVNFTGKRLDVALEVEQKQTVTVPAGEFECYKVVLDVENLLHQTLWYSADANQYLVKLDGEGFIGELASISLRGADEPVEYHDRRLGFTLSVPAGWYIYEYGEDKSKATKIHLIDPDGAAMSVMNAASLELTEIDVDKPVREYAQDRVSRSQKRLEGYTVRPDSWVERSINGRPAVSYVADYVERRQAMVEYRTYVLGEATLSRLRVFCEADRLDEIKPRIDQILSTFKAK